MVTGLRILMDHGVFLQVIVSDPTEAKSIITNWMSGQYRIKGDRIIGSNNPPPEGWAWAVEVDSIRAIHTFDPSEMLAQMRATRPTGLSVMPTPTVSGMTGPVNTPLFTR